MSKRCFGYRSQKDFIFDRLYMAPLRKSSI